MKKEILQNSLLEIGVEEIPARFMTPGLQQFESLLKEELSSGGVHFTKLEVLGTPRRIAALLHGVRPKTLEREEWVLGPPPKAAKNDGGAWTPAALGFAKSQNVSVEALVLHPSPKGERWSVVKQIKGQPTETILKEIYPRVIKNLTFPKTMVWDDSGFRFPRPLRWIVALWGAQVIRFKVGHILSDRKTIGLLSLGGAKIPISKPDKYKSIMQGRCILVDHDTRKKQIESQLDSVAKKLKATVITTPDHLDEVTFLTEYPSCIVGQFPTDYLKLPREILVLVLKKHQKFFPIESSKKQLTNNFVGVRNGPSEAQEEVREGYERVVNARLSDAQFFVEKDSRLNLFDMAAQLQGVGFHEKLGNMWDKTQRIKKITSKIGEALEWSPALIEDAVRAAHLCKSDLLTQIVGELPELQGVAGRFYTEGKEKEEISNALEQHYWPLTAEGALPMTPIASVVALADKMDTLVANFSIDLIPTGSADPYGLRRMAMGVIRILLGQKWDLPLPHLMALAGDELPHQGWNPAAAKNLLEFLKQRCITLFTSQGLRPDEIEAVQSLSQESLTIQQEKLDSLKSVRGRPDFEILAAAIKRSRNILNQAQQKGILPTEKELRMEELTEPSEIALFNTLNGVHSEFFLSLERGEYKQALLSLGVLKNPIDTFFKEVMVMVEDETVRSKRLRLLILVRELFDRLLDFSKLQGTNATPPTLVTAENG